MTIIKNVYLTYVAFKSRKRADAGTWNKRNPDSLRSAWLCRSHPKQNAGGVSSQRRNRWSQFDSGNRHRNGERDNRILDKNEQEA